MKSVPFLFLLLVVGACVTPTSTLQPAGATFEVSGKAYMFANSMDSIEVQCGFLDLKGYSARFRLLFFNHSSHEIWIDPDKIQMVCLDTIRNRTTTERAYDPEGKIAEIDKSIQPYKKVGLAIPSDLQKAKDYWQSETIRKTILFAGEEKYGDIYFTYIKAPKTCLVLVPTPSDTIAFPFREVPTK